MEPTPNTGIPPQPQTAGSSMPDRDIEENKDIAALGYVWVLSIFVYFYRKNSPFVRHHARQGIVLFILSLVFWAIPVVGRFLELPVLALMIMGFLNAAQGKYSPLPLVYALSHGDMRMLRQSWKVIVDTIVRMWHKIRSKHPHSGIKVSVQTTPSSDAAKNSRADSPPVAPTPLDPQTPSSPEAATPVHTDSPPVPSTQPVATVVTPPVEPPTPSTPPAPPSL